MKVTLEQNPDGHLVIDSRGVPADVCERMLLAALAGVQRELLARRVLEVSREAKATERVVREIAR